MSKHYTREGKCGWGGEAACEDGLSLSRVVGLWQLFFIIFIINNKSIIFLTVLICSEYR